MNDLPQKPMVPHAENSYDREALPGDSNLNSPIGIATKLPAVANQSGLEDPLAYLPCSTIFKYKKGQVIYNPKHPSTCIHLVIEGKVKIQRVTEGKPVVLDIYRSDEFFGESAFVGSAQYTEIAVALESTKVMAWTINEIEEIMLKRPKLGMALLQLLVDRSAEFGLRIISFSVDNIARRLAYALIRFSERLGSKNEDGSVEIMPFTHELLSQCVGTSREVVTQNMNHFRRKGYLRYSRKGITLYPAGLIKWLKQRDVTECS